MTSLKFLINNSNTDDSYANHPENFIEVDEDADELIFSGGSVDVADGQAIPTEEELNRAATLYDAISDVIVSKYFLASIGLGLLKEVKLAGNQNKRYVFCASFDGATATEPLLEAWDNENLNTVLLNCLGNGSPSQSWFRAKCTTDGLPLPDWAGTHLAGSGASYHVLLNNGGGALSGAKDLYFNFKIVIPAGEDTPAVFTPVLLITFTTN